MPKKMGGLVCDNDDCRKFADYCGPNIKDWIVVTVRISEQGLPKETVGIVQRYYCSRECEASRVNRKERE